MKRLLSSILVIILSFSAVSISVSASTRPSDWALNEVNNAISAGLVTDSVRKDYQADITREQFCEMVVLAYEKISNTSAEEGTKAFNDTNNSEILKAANLGIVSGYGNGIFGPDDLITREQIATMLVRMIDVSVEGEDVTIYNYNTFPDLNLIDDWALPAVNFAFDHKIIQGVDDNNSITPLDNTTCEQAILLIYRVVDLYGTYPVISGDESDGGDTSEEMLRNVFTDRAVGQNSDYLYFLPDDYDDDGSVEAFGITGQSPGDDIYSHVKIWFINSQGNCSLVKSDISGYLADPITTSNGKFINWYWYAGGSGGSSIILSCKGGQVFEPQISGKYDSFADKYTAFNVSDLEELNCDYIGYSSYFPAGGGHMRKPIAFDYNIETREFIERTSGDFDKLLTGDFSAAAGTYRNALGDEIVLLDNGLDSWSAENDDFQYKAGEVTKSPDGAYSWGILSYYEGEPLGGYGITLYPIGTDVTTSNGTVVNTDKSRVRLWAGNGSVSEDVDYIYYKQ